MSFILFVLFISFFVLAIIHYSPKILDLLGFEVYPKETIRKELSALRETNENVFHINKLEISKIKYVQTSEIFKFILFFFGFKS